DNARHGAVRESQLLAEVLQAGGPGGDEHGQSSLLRSGQSPARDVRLERLPQYLADGPQVPIDFVCQAGNESHAICRIRCVVYDINTRMERGLSSKTQKWPIWSAPETVETSLGAADMNMSV